MTPVAYLVSQYPALSHAFIEREVTELRAAGCAVTVLSVRRPDPRDLLSERSRADAAETVAIQGLPLRVLAADHLRALRRGPGAWVATARQSLRAARGVRSTVKRLGYFAEAVPVAAILRSRGIRHLHVHFANNAADIAELVVALGDRVDGPGRWSWSMSMHGPTEFADPVGYRLAEKVASASFVACISDFCRRQLLAAAPGTSLDRLPVVHMGVDAEAFPAAGTERAARSADDAAEGLRVLFVGRLVAEKAPVELVEALALVGRPLVARIVGDGPLRDAVEARIIERGLADRVRCLGGLGQDELPAQYRWADVFCLPSHAEGVPVVLMEAMATELPVLTTDIAGIPELVDATSGILVRPGDTGAFAAALRGLADDPAHRETLGRHGRERVLADFRSSVNARRLLQLLERAADRPASTGEGRTPVPDSRTPVSSGRTPG